MSARYYRIYFRTSPESHARGDSSGDPKHVLYDRTYDDHFEGEQPWFTRYLFRHYIEPRLAKLRSYGHEAWYQTTTYPGALY